MSSPGPDDSAAFLARDFNQCFEQMRYYDGQLWDICKFAFTAYTVLIGVAVGLYQRGRTISLRFFKARTLILVVAGFAAMSINSPGLNGFGTPFLAFRAGTLFFSIFTRPGKVNMPGLLRPKLLEI